jgi:hypothetical protein
MPDYQVTITSNGAPYIVRCAKSTTLGALKPMAIRWLSRVLDTAHGRGDHVLTIREASWQDVTTPERYAVGFSDWDWVAGREVFRL